MHGCLKNLFHIEEYTFLYTFISHKYTYYPEIVLRNPVLLHKQLGHLVACCHPSQNMIINNLVSVNIFIIIVK